MHYLQIQGGPNPLANGRAAEIVEYDMGPTGDNTMNAKVRERAQALADLTGKPVHACLDFGGMFLPDERYGDWGTFQPRPAAYIVFVDGEVFIRGRADADRAEALATFEETKRQICKEHPGSHEFALSIWKPRHGGYLRERLQIGAY
jgi:hypothetical protein